MEVRTRQTETTKSLRYNFTTFIYLKDKNNKTIAQNYINSYNKLDNNIIKDYINNNISIYGLDVLDHLYDKIDSYLFDPKSYNFKLAIKDNKELKHILEN